MAEGAAADEESFLLGSTVRGHHIFKRIWTPVIGQLLQVQAGTGNERDPHAVATVHNDAIVGHLPCEISQIAFYFLQHGGHIICEVTGRRKLSDAPNKGLVIPCLYTFWGKPTMIKRLVKVMTIKDKNQMIVYIVNLFLYQ